MYHPLRMESPALNSLMVQSTYRTVEARYKTVQTQLAQHPYHYNTGKKDKDGKEIWKSVDRTLEWLWKPIHFKRPQADYVRNSNYSFVKKGTLLSINVLGQRIKVPFKADYLQGWFKLDAHLGTAKLVCLKKHWFLHIPVTFDTDGWQIADNQHIVGIDRGLRQVMTVYDEQDKTKFFLAVILLISVRSLPTYGQSCNQLVLSLPSDTLKKWLSERTVGWLMLIIAYLRHS